MRARAWLILTISSLAMAAKPAKAKVVPPRPSPSSTPAIETRSQVAPPSDHAAAADLKLDNAALLAKTQELYGSLEYEQVIPLASALSARPDLTIDQRLEAYRLLGCAKAIVEDPVDAEKPFRLLLRARPEYDLPSDTTPKILSVFRKVQSEEQALARQLREVDRTRIISNLRLVGDPPSEFKGGTPLTFSFRLKDPTGAVDAVRLPYRREGQRVFSSLALERTDAGDWHGAVPAEFTADPHGFTMQYYVETADDEGPLLSLGTALSPRTMSILAGELLTERPKPVSRRVFIISASATAVLGIATGVFAILFNNSQNTYRALAQGQVDGAKLVAEARTGQTYAEVTNGLMIGTGAALLTTIVLSTLTNFSPAPSGP